MSSHVPLDWVASEHVAKVLRRCRWDENGCWTWQGSRTLHGDGYGRACLNGRKVYTHRVTFTFFVATISGGHEIDHLCRNKGCCNPAHLELVTRAENIRRIPVGCRGQADKTHCPRGHAYTPDNTYFYPGRLARACRICRADWVRQRDARLAEKRRGAAA